MKDGSKWERNSNASCLQKVGTVKHSLAYTKYLIITGCFWTKISSIYLLCYLLIYIPAGPAGDAAAWFRYICMHARTPLPKNIVDHEGSSWWANNRLQESKVLGWERMVWAVGLDTPFCIVLFSILWSGLEHCSRGFLCRNLTPTELPMAMEHTNRAPSTTFELAFDSPIED